MMKLKPEARRILRAALVASIYDIVALVPFQAPAWGGFLLFCLVYFEVIDR